MPFDHAARRIVDCGTTTYARIKRNVAAFCHALIIAVHRFPSQPQSRSEDGRRTQAMAISPLPLFSPQFWS